MAFASAQVHENIKPAVPKVLELRRELKMGLQSAGAVLKHRQSVGTERVALVN